ncbi:MAG TPA: 23S rRNA (adenine(2030)-N(6))-methyltransferase RlmJ [Rhizomicrobium sp.]|jgi:23S rRNA (adenine2030-N6)-methyltransferase
MNYRHAFHAGNFADVVKLVAEVAVILHLRRKDTPFCAIDTHAGAGLYDLQGPEAMRTGEAAQGIGRLSELAGRTDIPPSLAVFLDCVKREENGFYPGSSRIAARLLRPQDRLVAIDLQPEQARALRAALSDFANARALEDDGYARLLALLPPRERRGVVMIDPPYEAADEFMRAVDVLAEAHRRFATGIYLLWYPIKSRADADAFCGEVAARGVSPLLRIEIDVGHAPEGMKERLPAAGVLVVNPPYGFAEEMQRAAAFLSPRLGRTPDSGASITLVPPPS